MKDIKRDSAIAYIVLWVFHIIFSGYLLYSYGYYPNAQSKPNPSGSELYVRGVIALLELGILIAMTVISIQSAKKIRFYNDAIFVLIVVGIFISICGLVAFIMLKNKIQRYEEYQQYQTIKKISEFEKSKQEHEDKK